MGIDSCGEFPQAFQKQLEDSKIERLVYHPSTVLMSSCSIGFSHFPPETEISRVCQATSALCGDQSGKTHVVLVSESNDYKDRVMKHVRENEELVRMKHV